MLILLLVIFSLVIKLPAVQTYVVRKVGSFFSSEWNTTVSVGRVEIVFFDSIQIEGLFVGDQAKDTLLRVDRLTADISIFSLFDRKLVLEGVDLNGGAAKISRRATDGDYNFQFLIDYFESDTTTSSSKPFLFEPGNIKLNDFVVAYRDYRYESTPGGIDYDDVRCQIERMGINGINSSLSAYGLTSTSAGKSSCSTKRRIISRVKGLVRLRISATRPR